MTYKECYMELKKAMKLLQNMHVFEQFNYMNLFYLLDEKSKGIVIFSDHLMGESSGLQIHFEDSGINYLYDSYMSSTGMILNCVFADMVTVSLVSKEELTLEDIAYLKKHKIRLSTKNLIPCAFKEGHDYSYLTLKKMQQVIAYIYYLLSLIKNESEDIMKCFENSDLVLAAFDTSHHVYEVKYTNDLAIGSMPRFKKASQEFINEYKDATYVEDTCYISRYYSMEKVPTKEYYQSILFGYYPKKDTYIVHTIQCKPKQIGEYLIGFADELFKENHLPTKVILNERRMVSELYKTLQGLHIDVEFKRETEEIDTMFFEIMRDSKEGLKEGEQKLNVAFVS
ncbi:MAG: hypothetical protein K2K48_04590 [Anaeroplasmataceae bacterium]|nr:hypothetical protein [Anaeroplasmataceae bacterium]MDE6414671.1 hypothetical protein [Anaeroplasmataceae bacterium]